jgi:hypothetical protein
MNRSRVYRARLDAFHREVAVFIKGL